MRLEGFQIQNYKKINDTGWVDAKDLTALVGKNEAGKSAILKGLSKLNPSDGQKYDPLKEFPRRRYTDEFKSQPHWPVATGQFQLDEAEREDITKHCGILEKIERVRITRRSDWSLSVDFDGLAVPPRPTVHDLRAILDKSIEEARTLTAPEGRGEALGPIKQNVLSQLTSVKGALPADGYATPEQIQNIENNIASLVNEAWQKPLFGPLLSLFGEMRQAASLDAQLEKARQHIVKSLPKFVYFDRYDVLDSAVHIPTFAGQIKANPPPPRIRTTHCLFKHVGLDIPKLAALGNYERGQVSDEIRRQVDERAILLSSASNAMTKKFAEWWEQRKHVFRYQLDGDYFRVWVSDDLDPSEIELDQRSQGMQYFFSFYLVFQVEAEGIHENSILLLDEPGSNLHGTAQAKVVQFLHKLTAENQVIYTTHSPFMVDIDHLENVRAVYEDEADHGTTKISTNVWPKDRDALFPLQAALGYQLVQGLFISKRQVLVEGITDLWLLKALDHALGHRGLQRLRPDVILNPTGGTRRLVPLASMLMGHEVELAVLLDGDEPGRREAKKINRDLFVNDGSRTLFISDYTESNNGEIEDLFPEKMYLDAFRATHKDIDVDFTAAEKGIPGIVNRVEAMYKRRGLGSFEKWRVAEALRDQIIKAPEKLDPKTLENTQNLFAALNATFSQTAS